MFENVIEFIQNTYNNKMEQLLSKKSELNNNFNEILLLLNNIDLKDNSLVDELNNKNKILNQLNTKFINEISEKDKNNPCIQELLNYSSKIEFQSNSEIKDYELLMRSETLILSRSSFSDSVVFLSPNIKNVYFWNYNHCFSNEYELPTRINFHPYILYHIKKIKIT